ncbi:helicase HerA-like domain-containing protein [Pedobacter sp. CFBP9032]|uniref:helicase HerA-like domain-containing protein n=1 Tax=Pedobacter sp. CFBP9032 TaxID=3096539 RepID=UPI002A6A84D9|nr:helicase HerA-like domain-containing protein [Pedobacter sp. CFBP9032]MDY0903438.1 helicase HerA-like domain-containing protein [Pedobacter sp. CFBP9032]
MSESSTFIEKIKASYAPTGSYIYLGAGILDGQVYSEAEVNLSLKMMNRHGLIAGATGTGKTRTLQLLAEQLSDAGVPVFMLDVKGDLSGLNQAGLVNSKIEERAQQLNKSFSPTAFPLEIYSLSGKLGAQMRATVLEFGPTLLSKVLDLNDTQSGVMAVIFKYADDNKMPIIDLNDLKKLVSYLSEGAGAAEIKSSYGSISTATSGTILRKIVAIEQQGLGGMFGEKSFDIDDLLERVDGKGTISLLNIADVQNQPVLYSTFLLSLLAELFNTMPEVGDLEKPKLVFFFDEAHLLFKNSSKAFLEQIETIIRLIRSKGIGVFFCTQSPTDVPESVLGQLGNRVQHALRAFTPNDVDALKKTVNTYPKSDFYQIDKVLTSLGTGQALITVLNEKGIPTEVSATMLTPPRSVMGPLSPADFEHLVNKSKMYAKYKDAIDPESAYEMLTKKINDQAELTAQEKQQKALQKQEEQGNKPKPGEKSLVEQVMGATITRQIGKEIVRGIFGMLTGKKTRSKTGGFFGF